MLVKTLSPVFENLAKRSHFSNAYLCYGFNHPTLSDSVLDFVCDYFKAHESNFSYTKETVEHCSDIAVYRGSESLKIDDIREIKDRVKYGANHYSRLFVIIDGAERMTPEAANAFLKICEEPLDTVTFFLCTAYIKRILPTILSRCQLIFCRSDYKKAGYAETDLLSFRDYQAMDYLDQLTFNTQLAANKEHIQQQLEHWVMELNSNGQLDVSQSTLILETLERFQFNVNAKSQLDALLVSLNN